MTASAITALAWRSFICRACGLVYDEAEGDPDSGLAPGTRFDDIPEDWACPLCGVSKADFELHEAVPEVRRAPAAIRTARHGEEAGIVILGAGRGGWEAVRALRDMSPFVPITVVSADAGDVYDKPTLSVACSRGLGPADLVRETAADVARRFGVRLLSHTHAIRIDASVRRLRTTRGTLPYRQLVLAHGAAPRVIGSLEPAMCWRVNDLVAYQRLRAALGRQRRQVAVIGAGLVGCELANDLSVAGHGVTLIDTQPLPLSSHLPPLASERLVEAWRGLPLRFIGGVRVGTLHRQDGMVRLTTSCGQSVQAHQVIAATGLQPHTRLAAGAGLRTDEGGIAVDTVSLRTSDPHIHALGDCASVEGRAQRYIEPIARQAQAIASALLGDGSVHFVVKASPLRVKTSSMPLTLHGVSNTRLPWTVDLDSGGELRMSQREGDRVVTRLEASIGAVREQPPVAA